MKVIKKKKPWEINPEKKWTTKEWEDMDFDWVNETKVESYIKSYFWRYNNYQKAIETESDYIIKSTFGKFATKTSIEADLKRWFDMCVGAYTEIEYMDL